MCIEAQIVRNASQGSAFVSAGSLHAFHGSGVFRWHLVRLFDVADIC